jgi:hypothetical protein
LIEMARPERFELPTSWFVARRSIQLSYGRFGPAILPHVVNVQHSFDLSVLDASRLRLLLAHYAAT